MIDKTLAILAGGKSSRMGKDKAFLYYKEKTFIENIIGAGSDFSEKIIVANNEIKYKDFNTKVYSDIYLEKGPLGGIHSALKNAKYDKVLCIACDMPLMSTKVLNAIGSINENYEVIVPEINNRLQPMCAIYSKSLLPKIEKAINNGEYKLQKFVLSTNYKIIDNKAYKALSEESFLNINTEIEYKELEGI